MKTMSNEKIILRVVDVTFIGIGPHDLNVALSLRGLGKDETEMIKIITELKGKTIEVKAV